MPELIFRKSSHSKETQCVEVADGGALIVVRDSANIASPTLSLARECWTEFIKGLWTPAAALEALNGWSLPCSDRAPRIARAWVRSKVGGIAVDLDDVVLMADEVVTNAVVHGAGPIRLRLLQYAKTLRVEISDRGTAGSVTPRVPSATAEDGRGLVIIAALAADWGVVIKPGRTTVWFEVRLT